MSEPHLKPLRIGYFADGRWSHRALERIMEASEFEIAFIVARYPQGDPVLRDHAARLQVEYLQNANVNAPDFIARLAQYKADLFVSMSFDQILHTDIRRAAPLGFINCHAGALPFYRGRNILNWVLINGESRFGVTVHHVDEGIDTGDIIVQRFSNISADDDYATLLDRAVPICSDALFEALTLIQSGRAPRIVQSGIHPVGLYCSRRVPGDEWLDWHWPSKRIHDFVRALVPPGPGARVSSRKGEMAILKTELIPDALKYFDKPGTVIGTGHGYVDIKTGDTSLRVRSIAKVRPGGERGEAETPVLPIGLRLKVDLGQRVRELENRLRTLEEGRPEGVD